MKIIATHSSKFHTDDIFAVATLLLVLETDKASATIVRTRDPEIIKTADYVVDVGGIYDPENNRFDHHQIGGAGVGLNNIPYSSFGLVWKKYGGKLCGNEEVSFVINNFLVQPVDAHDNGIEIVKDSISGLYPYDLDQLKYILLPTWKEDDDSDNVFMKAVEYAKFILSRQIKVASDEAEGKELVLKTYQEAKDKRLVILDERWPWKEVLAKFSEPLYVIYPKRVDDTWSLKTVSADPTGLGLLEFVSRKELPKEWAGKRDDELEKITGVSGAVFCHRNRFLAVAKTKEAILKLAEIALNS